VLVVEIAIGRKLADWNCVVFDLADGTRVRAWLTGDGSPTNKVRVVIDAPKAVKILRGKLLGAEACGPEAGR
jgi:hypothetical protein